MASIGHRQQKLDVTLTLSEFISGIIQESVPDGEFQRHLATMAVSIVRGCQDEPSQNFLPSISCSVVGGDPIKVIPIIATWQFIRLAAKLFDDVEDGESGDRGAEFTNLATGYIFAAHTAMEKLPEYGISLESYRRLKNEFNRVCLETCAGQDVDLSTHSDRTIPTPDDWLAVARAKSGVLFAWASWAGALIAEASKEVQDALWEYGLHLGILVQISDDYNGIWISPSKSDLLTQRVTLPVSYSHFVANNDERECLISMIRETTQGQPDALSKERNLLIALGAQKFVLAAAQVQRQAAIEAINYIGLSNPANQQLVTLLNKTFPALVHLPLPFHETKPSCLADYP